MVTELVVDIYGPQRAIQECTSTNKRHVAHDIILKNLIYINEYVWYTMYDFT